MEDCGLPSTLTHRGHDVLVAVLEVRLLLVGHRVAVRVVHHGEHEVEEDHDSDDHEKHERKEAPAVLDEGGKHLVGEVLGGRRFEEGVDGRAEILEALGGSWCGKVWRRFEKGVGVGRCGDGWIGCQGVVLSPGLPR